MGEKLLEKIETSKQDEAKKLMAEIEAAKQAKDADKINSAFQSLAALGTADAQKEFDAYKQQIEQQITQTKDDLEQVKKDAWNKKADADQKKIEDEQKKIDAKQKEKEEKEAKLAADRQKEEEKSLEKELTKKSPSSWWGGILDKQVTPDSLRAWAVGVVDDAKDIVDSTIWSKWLLGIAKTAWSDAKDVWNIFGKWMSWLFK